MADDVEARAIRRIKELFSQPKQKLVGDTVALSDVSGSVKPVIFEFGFPAYVQGSIQPDKQHRALYEVWNGGTSTPTSGLKDALNLGFCIRGAASQRVGFLRGKSNTNTITLSLKCMLRGGGVGCATYILPLSIFFIGEF